MTFIDTFNNIKKLYSCYAFVFNAICKVHKFLLFILMLLLLINGCAQFIAQYIIKLIISLLEKRSLENVAVPVGTFVNLIIFYAVITILKNVSQNIQHGINRNVGFGLTQTIQALLIEKIKKVEYKSFSSQGFQNLYITILENSKNEPMIFVFTSFHMFLLFIQVLGNLIIVFNLNIFILFWLTFCLVISNLFINIKIEKSHVKVWDDSAKFCRLNDYIFDILTKKQFIKEVRLFNLSDYFLKKKGVISLKFQIFGLCSPEKKL